MMPKEPAQVGALANICQNFLAGIARPDRHVLSPKMERWQGRI